MQVCQFKHNNYNDLLQVIKSKKIRTVFQPIVSLQDGGILGYEALSRGPIGSPLESPLELFNAAKEHNMTWELELLCRHKALERSKDHINSKLLFLNVDPHIINDEKFRKGFTREFLKQFNINPNNIIFEITERSAINDFKSFRKVLNNYLEQGYKIAIDDTGSGYSGLQMLAETCPQYIKIDMELVRNIDKDFIKQALLKTFQKFSMMTNMKIIAEGIETNNELNTLIELGIDYGQGYFIQRPSDGFLSVSPRAKETILTKNEQKKRLYYHSPTSLPVGEIAKLETPIRPDTSGQEVDNIFRNNPAINGIPIVENNSPIGLIMRNKFYASLASQYGVVLYKGRPINLIMDPHPLTLDYYTPIDKVSRVTVTRKDEQLYDYIVITKDDKYYGITTVKDLLVNTTQLELNIAKHSNPLTGLPGNLLIEEKLKDVLENTEACHIIYVDLDNFKAYNDVYGFDNGDQVLANTASILSKSLSEYCPNTSFLGHIGGDDFLIVVPEQDVVALCQNIINSFDKEKLNFYSEQDKKNGYIFTENRHGHKEQFSLITISLAVIDINKHEFENIKSLTEKASEIKHQCKLINSSCYCIY